MTLNQTTLKIQLLVSRPKEMDLEDIREKKGGKEYRKYPSRRK